MPPAASAVVLVLTVSPGYEEDVKDALTDVNGIIRAVRFRAPEAHLTAVIGLSSALWDRLFPDLRKPAGLHPFVPLDGGRHQAPATPGDIAIHVRCHRQDMSFELARRLRERLGEAVQVVFEVNGFRYFDERDLLGFVDGTESPIGGEADRVVFVGEEDPGYKGGSYLVLQKYLHDLAAWNALTVEQQESAIGRHKLDDIEIPDDDKAPDAHARLTSISDADGNDRKIVRENMPFGSIAENEMGTCFIGYCATPDTIEVMLRNMFLGDPPGTYDRILDFSTAVSGGLFFVPTADFLDDPSVAPAAS